MLPARERILSIGLVEVGFWLLGLPAVAAAGPSPSASVEKFVTAAAARTRQPLILLASALGRQRQNDACLRGGANWPATKSRMGGWSTLIRPLVLLVQWDR